MERKHILTLVLVTLIFIPVPGSADYKLDMKMRFYQGAREGGAAPPEFVTSSYLRPMVTATIPARFLLAEEKEQIGKVFNLKSVNLVTEADLEWSSGKGKIAHAFRLDGKGYFMQVSVLPGESRISVEKGKKAAVHRFALEVFEEKEGDKTRLVETEVLLPSEKMVVLGFEDREGTPYFLSLQVTRIAGTPPSPATPPPPKPPGKPATPPPPPPPTSQEVKDFEAGAVRVEGEIKPPKLIKKVAPVYPEEAREARVGGVVVLAVRTDTQGRVYRTMVVKSKTPLLNQAAVDAVKQWVYEPLVIDGEPREAVFLVTVAFKLRKETRGEVGGVAGGTIRAAGGKPPRLVRKVDPVYPPEAREAGIQGIVVLEATTDEKGNVVDVKVLRSESSLLNEAAVEAVRRWKYEPVVREGKPVPMTFTVTVKFKLDS